MECCGYWNSIVLSGECGGGCNQAMVRYCDRWILMILDSVLTKDRRFEVAFWICWCSMTSGSFVRDLDSISKPCKFWRQYATSANKDGEDLRLSRKISERSNGEEELGGGTRHQLSSFCLKRSFQKGIGKFHQVALLPWSDPYSYQISSTPICW